jgi:hypothetical protein
MAIIAFAAESASATTLEIDGVTQNKAVTLEAEATTGAVLARTDGTLANTCTESKVKGTTSVFTGTKVTGALSSLTFKKCTTESVVVDAAGQLYVEHEAGTTDGAVYSENASITVPTSLGFTVTCQTGPGTKIAKLVWKGVKILARIIVSAVLNCGFLLPSATWKGEYVSSPAGLGVSA